MKPEDITQEVWDAAYKAVYRGDWTVVEQVARAIMAAEKRGEEREREACALLLDEGFDREGIVTKNDTCPHKKYGWEDCEQCASAAIRNRGKP